MGLKIVTPPSGYPVTLAEAKAQLSIPLTDTDDDTLIEGMIAAATGALEGPMGRLGGRCLMSQTWDYYRDGFPDCDKPMRLPLAPLISVSSVNYIDPDSGIEGVWSSSNYEVDTASALGWISPGDTGWPTPMQTINAVRVRFVAGYGDPSDSPEPANILPAAIRHAILITVRDLYDNRGAFVIGANVSPLNSVERLIAPYRVYTL